MTTPRLEYKVILLGESGAGKSSIYRGLKGVPFQPNHTHTHGCDFITERVEHEGQTMRINVWDTAGQERFRSIITSYMRGCDAAIIVYDVTNEVSFERATPWLSEVMALRSRYCSVWLCANKIDLAGKRVISDEDGARCAMEMGAHYLETSAKTGHNIRNLKDQFKQAAIDQILLKKIPELRVDPDALTDGASSTDSQESGDDNEPSKRDRRRKSSSKSRSRSRSSSKSRRSSRSASTGSDRRKSSSKSRSRSRSKSRRGSRSASSGSGVTYESKSTKHKKKKKRKGVRQQEDSMLRLDDCRFTQYDLGADEKLTRSTEAAVVCRSCKRAVEDHTCKR